jgi:hypothetical protein
VDFYAWMLALHLIAGVAVGSALTLFSVMVYAGRRMTTLDETRALFRIGPFGGILISAGIGLVLVLGIILALDSSQFEIWDGWVIAAIVLWAVLAGVGQASGKYYTDVQKLAEAGNETEVLARLRASTGVLLHLATVGAFLLIVLDMIFKPGA